jgi:hypothetical protein
MTDVFLEIVEFYFPVYIGQINYYGDFGLTNNNWFLKF